MATLAHHCNDCPLFSIKEGPYHAKGICAMEFRLLPMKLDAPGKHYASPDCNVEDYIRIDQLPDRIKIRDAPENGWLIPFDREKSW